MPARSRRSSLGRLPADGQAVAQAGFHALDVAALRYAGAFLGALVLAAFLGWPRLPPLKQAVIVLTAGYGFPLFAYHGFSLAPAAHGAVLNAGMLPFYTAALGMLLLGERWTRARGVSLGIVAVGIALLAFDTFGEHPGAWRGDVMFTLGCMSWAVYTVLVRRWGIGAIPATLGSAIWAGPPFLVFWWLFPASNLGALPLAPSSSSSSTRASLPCSPPAFCSPRR